MLQDARNSKTQTALLLLLALGVSERTGGVLKTLASKVGI